MNEVVPAGIVILLPAAGAVNEVTVGWLVDAVNGAMPPVMLYVAVPGPVHPAPPGIVWVAGVTVNVVVAPTVRVAVTVVPTESLIVYITVAAGVFAGTVTTNVPPLAVTVAGAGAVHAAALFLVIVYGAIPPFIVNVAVPPATPSIFIAEGDTESAVVTSTVVVALTLPMLAVIVHVMTELGAVNVAVAEPPVVLPNGVIFPPAAAQAASIEKLTAVPSGTYWLKFVRAVAVIVDVDAVPDIEGEMTAGLATMVIELTVTGLMNNVFMFEAPLLALAKIFRLDVKFLRLSTPTTT